jgi:hypothetical protein
MFNMEMDMQHGHENAAWTKDMHHGHVHAARTWTCSMDVDMEIQQRWTWTSSMVIDIHHGDGHAAWKLA